MMLQVIFNESMKYKNSSHNVGCGEEADDLRGCYWQMNQQHKLAFLFQVSSKQV